MSTFMFTIGEKLLKQCVTTVIFTNENVTEFSYFRADTHTPQPLVGNLEHL